MFYFPSDYEKYPIIDTATFTWSTGKATWQLRKTPIGHLATVLTPTGLLAGSADPNCPVKDIPATYLDKCGTAPNNQHWVGRARAAINAKL